MKWTRIRNGYYKSDNGFYIKSNAGKNIFTSRMMRADFWYIYDGEPINGRKWIGGGCTLREAKAEAEELAKKRECDMMSRRKEIQE